MGNINMMEILAQNYDSVTIKIGDDIYLTVMTAAGAIDSALYECLEEVKIKLLKEAGI